MRNRDVTRVQVLRRVNSVVTQIRADSSAPCDPTLAAAAVVSIPWILYVCGVCPRGETG